MMLISSLSWFIYDDIHPPPCVSFVVPTINISFSPPILLVIYGLFFFFSTSLFVKIHFFFHGGKKSIIHIVEKKVYKKKKSARKANQFHVTDFYPGKFIGKKDIVKVLERLQKS